MKKYYYIYKITILKGSLKNHYYIGKHETNDINDGYLGSGKIINRYYKKYGKENNVSYKKEILCWCKSTEELNNAESFYIGTKYETDKMCLNLISGGHGGKLCKESEEKMQKSMLKRYENPEAHKKIQKSMLKRYENPEAHKKTREAALKRYKNLNIVERDAWGKKYKGRIEIVNDNEIRHKRIFPTDLPYWESLGWYRKVI